MGRRRPPRRSQQPRFTQSQIQHMEKAFIDMKDALVDQSFYQKITDEINIASGHAGKKAIEWRQVKRWHEHHAAKMTSPSITSDGKVSLPDASLSNNTPDSSSDIHKGWRCYIEAGIGSMHRLSLYKDTNGMGSTHRPSLYKDTNGEMASAALEWEFEARSSNGAWYDVATFLEERVASSGELEVRVRYQGFGSEEDEWVSVKKAIRVRSLPLESSECRKVAVGDLVLCFQESGDDAAHFDAHVIDIQRKLHDIRGCRCIFLIRYDLNQTEERVHLRRLCRRP